MMANCRLGYGCAALLIIACANADPTAAGSGNEKFTTWGEAFIETGIPANPNGQDGFIDGWALHYDKFLVNFHGIVVADSAGNVAATLDKPKFVDNTVPGRKTLTEFDGLRAENWDKVSYQIKPAVEGEDVVAGDPSDLAKMIDNGWSIYVEGSATKAGSSGQVIRKTFHWGFKVATQFSDCHHEENGTNTLGVVVTTGSTDVTELTTHGDHLFYDRLQASPDPAIQTALRFDQKAAADEAPYGNGDGEITLEEMCAEPIDVFTYDPSGLNAPTIGDFVIALSRTIGHYRGEGECTISPIGERLKSPCLEL
jgi:hypothetical protein